jgi:hypothetical protein
MSAHVPERAHWSRALTSPATNPLAAKPNSTYDSPRPKPGGKSRQGTRPEVSRSRSRCTPSSIISKTTRSS